MKATPEDVVAVADLARELAGIVLDASKGYLVESRLGRLAQEAGCNSYVELTQLVRTGRDPALRERVIDALTTNETLWFRDRSPFECLRNRVLPDVIDLREGTPLARRIRIWCAAASTGQEPYSIAMTVRELLPDPQEWDVRILATDISEAALARARAGVYSRMEMERGLPEPMLRRHFIPDDADGEAFRIRPEVASMVQFRRMNLLAPFPGIGPFDIIFCRNVAIYFDREVQADLWRRLVGMLAPTEGVLFAGASETLHQLGPEFRPQIHCRAVYYRPHRPEGGTVRAA